MIQPSGVTYLDIDAAQFSDAFGARSFLGGHGLVGHPLFTDQAICELAGRLPSTWVRREQGDLPRENRGYVDTGTGPLSETLSAIERNNTRMSLREIQQDATYVPLIRCCHDEIRPLVGTREGGVCGWSGYIFVTSPGSTTPIHLDPEHSFLLQLRGTKRIFMASELNPAALAREIDRFMDGATCDVDVLRSGCEEFVVRPGEAIYLPSFTPHWVISEEDVSMSFSLPFFTPLGMRAEAAHRFNARLRRLGLSPRPPGFSDARDRGKLAALRAWSRVRGNAPLPLRAAPRA